MKESTYQKIIRKTGRKPIECKCQACKQQCKTPCLGTPQDIMKIIESGFGDRLFRTHWAVGLLLGHLDTTVPMVQAEQTPNGCIFHKNGLCELHILGLKPTEGKLSHHSIREDNFKLSKSLSWNVAREWVVAENAEIVATIFGMFDNSEGRLQLPKSE